MRPNRKLLAAALLGVGLAAGTLSITGCTHLGDKTVGATLDDATIKAKVKVKFIEDKTVSALNIKVDSYNGVVQLSGFANSPEEARRAEQLAREVSGVKVVKNDIRLKPAA
ncbi:MAG TPA: BON domain-containing protein [Usitatibacter sp.]|nr:BON domain-containing protein [Usitatibacter sp.]